MNESKSLPNNEQVERFILGGILLDNELIIQCLGDLHPDDFYTHSHKPFYAAMEFLAQRGEEINEISVVETLKNLHLLETIGTIQDVVNLLTGLKKGLPKPKKLDYYVKILRERSIERQKIKTTEQIQAALMRGDGEAALEFESRLFDLTTHDKTLGAAHTSDFSDAVLNKIYTRGIASSPITGLATGILDFDLLTSGLQPDDLVILAARPGQGKTAMSMNIAQFSAIKRKSVCLVFSIEMSQTQLYMRMLAGQSRINMQKLKTGYLTGHEWARLVYAKEKIDSGRIIIDDTVNLTPLKLRATFKKHLIKEKKIDLVIVDYLQLMNSDKKTENRQQEVTQISKELKGLAKEFHVPVIALSQLSRAPETRSSNGHRPQTSDLRESGSIEQDADIVAFIYREEVYGKTPENAGLAELIITKHRNGDTATIPLAYIKEHTSFKNLFLVKP